MRIGWLIVIAPPGRAEVEWNATAKQARAAWRKLSPGEHYRVVDDREGKDMTALLKTLEARP